MELMTNRPKPDPAVVKILSREPDGFNQRYEELLPKFKYYYEAYEAVEDEYESITGRKRYDSYDSFRKVRERLLKSKNGKPVSKFPKYPSQNNKDKAA